MCDSARRRVAWIRRVTYPGLPPFSVWKPCKQTGESSRCALLACRLPSLPQRLSKSVFSSIVTAPRRAFHPAREIFENLAGQCLFGDHCLSSEGSWVRQSSDDQSSTSAAIASMLTNRRNVGQVPDSRCRTLMRSLTPHSRQLHSCSSNISHFRRPLPLRVIGLFNVQAANISHVGMLLRCQIIWVHLGLGEARYIVAQ